MTKTYLSKIKESVQGSKEAADRIMDGGDNYDGADGAREVQQLCDTAQELIAALETSGTLTNE